jgi:predicted DNA-binding ribbon-helix-helix protein
MPKLRNKRSVTIDRHRTSISLEEPFWDALSDIAKTEDKSLAALIGVIDKSRGDENLSAAIRLYVLKHSRR